MRRLQGAVLAAFLVAGITVVRADVWTDLGSQESEAKGQTVQSILNGWVPGLGQQAFKKAAMTARVAIVQQVVAWAKTFTQSAAFKTSYDSARSNMKPEPPTNPGTYQEQMKKQRDEFEKNIVEMRKGAAAQSKEIRDAIENTIKQTRAQMDEMAKNTEMLKMMETAVAQQWAAAQTEYKTRLAQFDKDHPPTPQGAVALRLRRFVDVCGTVDFAAKLTPASGGKMKFVNAQDEQKSSEWKMCYRAGREPVEAALTLARTWLKELGG